jgi:hypothetical protein
LTLKMETLKFPSRKIRSSGHVHNPTPQPHSHSDPAKPQSKRESAETARSCTPRKPPPPAFNLNPRHPDSLRQRRPASSPAPMQPTCILLIQKRYQEPVHVRVVPWAQPHSPRTQHAQVVGNVQRWVWGAFCKNIGQ